MYTFARILKIQLIVSSLIVSYPVWSDTAPIDISGNYTCTGTDVSDNSQYTVDLTVKKTGDAYTYTSIEKGINNKTQNFLGKGIFAKNSNNTFAAEFWQEDDPSNSGIVIGQMQADGGWESIWSWRNQAGINSEVCKKNK